MKYAVVLPAYNEEDLIEKTLQSLFQQTYPPQEVVVVDDQSTDKTAALVKQWAKSILLCSSFSDRCCAAPTGSK